MGLVDLLFERALRFVIFFCTSLVIWIREAGAESWICADAIVTAEPSVSQGLFGSPTVEVVYSYRFEGELYTGLHEEPFLSNDSLREYVARFSNGRKFVVRFNPRKPDHSMVREQDQVMELAHS